MSTGTSLIETLQILEHYGAARGALLRDAPDYLHHVIEAWKVRDPLRRIADPALWPVEVAPHLDPAHAATLFERIDPAHAMPFSEDADTAGQGQGERIGRGTTAFAVGDADGNMIVVTQTLTTWGGNFYVSKGLGFLYNNHLRGYRTVRGAYGQLLPLMRSSSTSAPTLVCEDVNGTLKPRLAVGAAGNAWIAASVYAIILGHVDGGLGAQAAIEAPRLLVARDPADPAGLTPRVQIEDRFPAAVLDDSPRAGIISRRSGARASTATGTPPSCSSTRRPAASRPAPNRGDRTPRSRYNGRPLSGPAASRGRSRLSESGQPVQLEVIMPTSRTSLLIDQLHRAFDGDPWHGPSVVHLLEDVTFAQAMATPPGGVHSIAAIVAHMTSWVAEVTRRVTRASGGRSDRGRLADPARDGQAGWAAMHLELAEAMARLTEAVAGFPEARWDDLVGDTRDAALGTGVTYEQTVLGLVQHLAYHGGQVAILRKLVG